MKQLEKVQNNTTWAKASNAINNNNDALYVAVTTLEHAAFKNKGYFKSVALLYGAYPTAENGAQAFVYNSSNPTSAPYDIYEWVNGGWQDSGVNGGNVNVNLDSKQDTLVGYSESVSEGKATQVAIQGDTIALSGKVSLGNVDNMESAILMSSSQAGAAIAKANSLEQSMSALKSPVKPLHVNSQGKLELNIGKGLYIEDGKLCTTGASGGGGGGTTLSEGQGIHIYNDTINVAYDIDTLRVNSCGGLTVNYGEGLTIKNGKLSAQASVNAGNGLVQKGDELSVNISTGLQYGSDGELAVKTGKGLSVDNTGTINANIDNSTIATNSDGAMYVQKGMLAGQGLKVSLDRLAVNYGAGLALSNKALVIAYGAGLDIQGGKLVSTVQGGNTYTAGNGIYFKGNSININDTILNLGTRVRDLGDFASSGDAENKAKEASISGDNAIVIMRYTVSSAKKQGVILQQVGDYRTVQYQLWDGGIYTRYVWFTDNTRQTLNNGLNANEKWWKLGATHTNYDSSTRKIHLANKDDSNINANDSAVIPIVSSSVAGLMSSSMLNTLNDAQSKLVRYTEGMSDNKSTASINADEISMTGSSLKLHNVVRVCGALFSGIQTKGNININGKSVIASNIDAGEFKVLNGASNYGFILRTVDNPNDQQGLMLVELLSTDGYDAYKYTFPAKSGEVALKGDYTAGSGISMSNNTIAVKYDSVTISTKDTTDNSLRVILGSGLTQGTSGICVAVGSGLEIGEDNKIHSTVSSGKTYTAGDGISISGNKISAKCNDGIKIACGYIAIATGDGLHIKDNKLAINTSDGLGFTTDGLLKLKLHEKSGLQATTAGLGVNAGVALGTSDGKLNVQYGTGLSVGNGNIYVNTSKIAGEGVDIESDSKKLAIGTKAAKKLAGAGLVADGPMIKVKYGSGLAINSCGKLQLNPGRGIAIKCDSISVALSSHFTLDCGSSGIALRLGSCLTLEQDEFDYSASKVNVKISSNFTSEHEGIVVKIGSGLTTDNKGTIKLPFITAQLTPNAVDKSRNGVQKIMDINPNTIKFKLSTGLGIDECGYLYVTK